MKRLVILLVALLVSSCALKGTARHQAVVGSTGLYAAIAGVDDVEMALSASGALTPAQHTALTPQIVRLLKAGQAANKAILVWPQGQPAPAELQAAIQQLGLVAHSVIDLLPDGAAKSRLSTALLLAQEAANLLLLIHPSSGTGGTDNGPGEDSRVRAARERADQDWGWGSRLRARGDAVAGH